MNNKHNYIYNCINLKVLNFEEIMKKGNLKK